MSRWSKYLGNSVNFAVEKTPKEGFLENFFETRVFEPRNEQEQKEYDDFSFISTALSLAVYVSLADDELSPKEKERIISEMIFQVEQYPYEYACLSEKFGNTDKEIVNSLFEKFKDEILSKNYDLANNIRIINMIYENNPYKKYYLLRLCFIIGFTDTKDINREIVAINDIAAKLHIPDNERDRIKKEVMKEYKFN